MSNLVVFYRLYESFFNHAVWVALLILAAVFVLWLAVRIFRYGAMSYDSKLSLSALRMKRKADKV